MARKINVSGGLTLALMAILVAGCGDSKPASSDSGAKRLVIAAIPKSTGGEFWETVEVAPATPPSSWT